MSFALVTAPQKFYVIWSFPHKHMHIDGPAFYAWECIQVDHIEKFDTFAEASLRVEAIKRAWGGPGTDLTHEIVVGKKVIASRYEPDPAR